MSTTTRDGHPGDDHPSPISSNWTGAIHRNSSHAGNRFSIAAGQSTRERLKERKERESKEKVSPSRTSTNRRIRYGGHCSPSGLPSWSPIFHLRLPRLSNAPLLVEPQQTPKSRSGVCGEERVPRPSPNRVLFVSSTTGLAVLPACAEPRASLHSRHHPPPDAQHHEPRSRNLWLSRPLPQPAKNICTRISRLFRDAFHHSVPASAPTLATIHMSCPASCRGDDPSPGRREHQLQAPGRRPHRLEICPEKIQIFATVVVLLPPDALRPQNGGEPQLQFLDVVHVLSIRG
ncbi:hypothetical protein CSOJ01_12198 [Colletotrichum sojae]|uniref:Uncharacterized protein n=1 Tax=Colletotrichum sojae TaxID=2175907 RepID=A0A8H6IVF8_9PEZI|nr:hypothetical protein CSOJ01_12198 [Colletotrichum sojae]